MCVRVRLVVAWSLGVVLAVLTPARAAELILSTQDFAPFKDLAIDMTPDDEAAFKKLSLGRVLAVFSNRDVGYDLLRKLAISNVRYAGCQQSLKYYVGFSQKFEAVLAGVREFWAATPQSDDIAALALRRVT